MRNRILFAASALIAIAASTAAFAGDIVVAPHQDTGASAGIAGTSISLTAAGRTTSSTAAVGNLTTATSNGGIAASAFSAYNPSQRGLSDQTASLGVSTSAFAGASLSASALSNETDLVATGFVNVDGVSQIDRGNVRAGASLSSVLLTDTSSVSASVAGNVLTAKGNGVNVTSPASAGAAGAFDNQSVGGNVQVAGLSLNNVAVLGGGSFTGTAQALGNSLEATGFGQGVTLATSQEVGHMPGNSVAPNNGYTGSETSTTAALSASGLGVFSGTTKLTSLATGNNLIADASFGGNIQANSYQASYNSPVTASTSITGSVFAAPLTVGATSITNAASYTTH